MNDNYTIEEVCSMINQYITERAPRGAYKKYLAQQDKKMTNEFNKYSKIADLIPYNKHAASKAKDIAANHDIIRNKTYNTLTATSDGSGRKLNANYSDPEQYYYLKHGKLDGGRSYGDRISETLYGISNSGKRTNNDVSNNIKKDVIKIVKSNFGQGKDPRSELEKKPAGLYATKKESTNIIDTKLAIYESCDAGYITEDEKIELLSLLED